MKARTIAAGLALCLPATAYALQVMDEMRWPETGSFPAYPIESDGRQVRFSVLGAVDWDSNPFRLSDGTDPQTTLGSAEKSDTVGRYGVGLKADLPAQRQRVLLDAQVARHDYHRFDVLDHTAYRAAAAWKWQAGERWGGDIGYSRRQFLASLAELQAPIRDLVVEDRAYLGGGYRATPRWRVRGAADWIRWDHDEPTRQTLDATIVSGTLGLDYVTPLANSVGGQLKYSAGDYPNREVVAGSLVDNSYTELEGSVVAHWVATGKSTLDGRVGYTARRHDQVPERDFDGATGRLAYGWFIGAKTLLDFSAWREIQSTEDVSASYILAQGWGIGPAWAPTVKLVFQAKYVREDRDYRGDPGIALSGTPEREDTFRGIAVAAGYAPRRFIRFALGAQFGERTSNVVGRDYDYNAVSATANLLF